MTAHNPDQPAIYADYDYGLGLHENHPAPFDPENLNLLIQALEAERSYIRFL